MYRKSELGSQPRYWLGGAIRVGFTTQVLVGGHYQNWVHNPGAGWGALSELGSQPRCWLGVLSELGSQPRCWLGGTIRIGFTTQVLLGALIGNTEAI